MKIGTREEWLKARIALLQEEKALTRRSDAVAAQRRALPWVRLDKDYQFDTDDGRASLADLFKGRSQLIVYHFMFGPDWTAGCPSCSSVADGFTGIVGRLEDHGVAFTAVSRAKLAKLQAYKERKGWKFPWASSLDGDFNFDFDVSFTEEQQRDGSIEYNFARGGHAMDIDPPPAPVVKFGAACGVDARTYGRDRPGMSAFAREDGAIYHTLFGLFARPGRAMGHVSVARPGRRKAAASPSPDPVFSRECWAPRASRDFPAIAASRDSTPPPDHVGDSVLHDRDVGADQHFLQHDRDVHPAGQVRIVELVRVAELLVRHELEILAAERVRVAGGEVAERHAERAADPRILVVHRTPRSRWAAAISPSRRLRGTRDRLYPAWWRGRDGGGPCLALFSPVWTFAVSRRGSASPA